jgi:hypothetical protein
MPERPAAPAPSCGSGSRAARDRPGRRSPAGVAQGGGRGLRPGLGIGGWRNRGTTPRQPNGPGRITQDHERAYTSSHEQSDRQDPPLAAPRQEAEGLVRRNDARSDAREASASTTSDRQPLRRHAFRALTGGGAWSAGRGSTPPGLVDRAASLCVAIPHPHTLVRWRWSTSCSDSRWVMSC